MDISKNIYVIELEDSHFLIYVSQEMDPVKILIDCEIYYDFTKIHKPLKIIKTLRFENDFIVDSIVKEYMYMFGINYVYGGSYLPKLTTAQIEIVRKEFDYIETKMPYEREFYEVLSYESTEYSSVAELNQTLFEITEHFEKYKVEKNRYDKLFPKEYSSKVIDIHIEDIEWLCNKCLDKNNTFERGDIPKYKKILKCFNHMYFLSKTTTFLEDKMNIFEEYEVYLQYPQFLFDSFIYNSYSKSYSIIIDEKVEKVCNLLKHIFVIITNRIDEYKFDLSTYEPSIEWKTPRILYILEKKRNVLLEALCNS
jgi:hypothetical protein